MVLTIVGSVVLTGWMCIVLYHLILSLMSWMTGRREAPLIFPRHHFAVLIPVYNDESTIGPVIERLLRTIQYPRSMFDMLVIPVQCTDRTTVIARQKGAIVYGSGKRKWRHHDEAIQTVLERLSFKRRYDAYVILDVAVDVSPDFLAILSDKLSKGAQIIQSGYRVSGPITSWREGVIAGLQAIAPSLYTIWIGRFRLTAGLRRVGVCLSRSLVEKYGVRSPALSDGLAYTIRLLADNVVVTFAPKAVVIERSHAFPPPRRSLRSHAVTRWRLIRRYAVPLIREGIRWRSAAQMVGGLGLLIPPFSWMFAGAALLFVLTLIVRNVAPYPMSDAQVVGWEMVLFAQVALVMNRLAYARAPALTYVALPSIPAYLMWRTGRAWVRGLFRRADRAAARDRAPQKPDNAVQRRRINARRDVRRSPSG